LVAVIRLLQPPQVMPGLSPRLSGSARPVAKFSRLQPSRVVPGLVPGIHAERKPPTSKSFLQRRGVDGRDKPGHDVKGWRMSQQSPPFRHFSVSRTALRLERRSRDRPKKKLEIFGALRANRQETGVRSACDHQSRAIAAPSRTSASRARVARPAPSGRASCAKNRTSAISRSGICGLVWRKRRTI
jgi:hypothetical protein